MKVLIDGVTYRLVEPDSEASLEKAIQANSKHIFGENSFYFDVKKIIRSKAGVASIPDGYAILFDPKPRWCIVEVELASHPIYDHVISQLSKFNRGIEDTQTRKNIIDLLYEAFSKDDILKAQLKKKIKSGEIYKFILDLLSEEPLIIVVIDEKTAELQEALVDLRGEVKALEFKTFRREGVSEELNAYVFEPLVGTKLSVSERKNSCGTGRGISGAIYALFDAKGVDNVTYNECESLARRIKPGTKFNTYHFSWYKGVYKKQKSGTSTQLRQNITVTYDEQYHIGGKPEQIVQLFHRLEKFCMNIDAGNIARNYLAKYVRYDYQGHIFCCVHIDKSKIRIWLKLKYDDLNNPPSYARDVSKVGHWGTGNVEVNIADEASLEGAKALIRKSFEENKAG
jgi:predicted transport protein